MGELNGSSVSVIIPCYEATDKLKRTLWSIEQNADLPYEVIVAKARQCVAKNRNDGLKKAKHDLILMMDDDVILPPFFMSKLATVLEHFKSCGVISAKMTNMDGTPQNDLASIPPGTLMPCVPPGTCFMYSKWAIEGCTFDEKYEGSQWEDTDFMAQVAKMELGTWATGDVWILHDNSWTGHTTETWKKNKARFIEKHPTFAEECGIQLGSKSA